MPGCNRVAYTTKNLILNLFSQFSSDLDHCPQWNRMRRSAWQSDLQWGRPRRGSWWTCWRLTGASSQSWWRAAPSHCPLLSGHSAEAGPGPAVVGKANRNKMDNCKIDNCKIDNCKIDNCKMNNCKIDNCKIDNCKMDNCKTDNCKIDKQYRAFCSTWEFTQT